MISSRQPERAAILETFTKYFTPELCDKDPCEDPQHPNEDQKLFESIADRMFKVAFDLLQQRELWVLLYQPAPGLPMAMTGPFASASDAKKGAETLVGGAAQAVKVIPFSSLRAQSEADTEAYNNLFGLNPCAECSHEEWCHGSMGFKKGGGLGSVGPPAKNRCSVGCQCKTYKRRDE